MHIHLLSALALAAALAACGGESAKSPDLIGGSTGDTVGGPSIAGGAGAPSINGGAGSPSINGGAANGPVVLSGGGTSGTGGGSSTGTFCAAGQSQPSQSEGCACIVDGTEAGLSGYTSSGYTPVASCNSSTYPCCFQVSSTICGCTSPPAQATCAGYLQAAGLQMLSSCP